MVDIDVEKHNPFSRLRQGHAPQHDVVDIAKSPRPIRKRVVIPARRIERDLAFPSIIIRAPVTVAPAAQVDTGYIPANTGQSEVPSPNRSIA